MRLADLTTLSTERLKRLAPVYADLAFALGMALTREDGSTSPVPAVLSPVVLSSQELARRGKAAHRIATLAAKVARALLRSEQRGLVLDGLTPLARAVVEKTYGELDAIPLVRVDFAADADGGLKAVQVHCAGPALVGYSDIAAQSLIRALGHERAQADRAIAKLSAKNGANAEALLEALRACYQTRRGNKATPTVALVAPRQHPQRTELEYLTRAWTSLGCPSYLAAPEDLTLGGEEMRLRGRRVDVLLRSVHFSELRTDSALSRILAEPARFMVFNQVTPHVESGVALAELSAAVHDPKRAQAFGLTEDDLEAAASTLCWTRRLVPGVETGPDGTAIPDLLAHVKAHPERYAIRRSSGRSDGATLIGAFIARESTQRQVRAVFGEALTWPELVARAAADGQGGGFVVQEWAETPPQPLLVCDESGEARAQSGWADLSAFTSVGLDVEGWGFASRVSLETPVTSIAHGSGVAPVLREDVVQALLD